MSLHKVLILSLAAHDADGTMPKAIFSRTGVSKTTIRTTWINFLLQARCPRTQRRHLLKAYGTRIIEQKTKSRIKNNLSPEHVNRQ